MKTSTLTIYIAVAALITFLLRLLPLVFYRRLKNIPPLLTRLTDVLPLSIMAILLVYCLRDGFKAPYASGIPLLAGTMITVFIHLLKKNTMLSIICGTAVYMIVLRII